MYIDTHTHRLKSNRQKQAHRHRYKNREIKIARHKETNRIQTWITRYTYMHTHFTHLEEQMDQKTYRQRQTDKDKFIYICIQTNKNIYIHSNMPRHIDIVPPIAENYRQGYIDKNVQIQRDSQ